MKEDTVSKEFAVQTIRINSYEFEPTEHVVASPVGIRISVPNAKEANENVIIDIPKKDISGIASYFTEDACILFISMSKECALKIKDCFEMNEFLAEYQVMLRITSTYHCALSAIYLTFDPAEIELLDEGDYTDILDRLESRDQLLLIYPPPHKAPRGLQINREDYKCLSVNKCINDAIIDFYLKYLHEEKLTDEQRNRTYIFSQFFYTRLAADGHAGVKKWSKNVNLYEKDFIIVPIIIGNHWILAVICFPHDSSKHTNEKPCILIFDSVANDDDNDLWNEKNVTPITIKLREYLTSEIGGKFKESRTFNGNNMPAYIVEVPQQNNMYDSGLYLLQYVENFFQCPIKDYRNIDVLNQQLCNWFDENVINRKREDIASLIKKLVQEYNPYKLPLPNLNRDDSSVIDLDDDSSENGSNNSEEEEDEGDEDSNHESIEDKHDEGEEDNVGEDEVEGEEVEGDPEDELMDLDENDEM